MILLIRNPDARVRPFSPHCMLEQPFSDVFRSSERAVRHALAHCVYVPEASYSP